MILLILLLVFETALIIYRIKTKSMQQRLTLILRIASVLMLCVFSVLSVITWGFRYYALALGLIVSVIVNGAQLLYKKTDKHQNKRIFLKAFKMPVLLLISLLLVIVFPEYRLPLTTGEYQVLTATKHFSDESRVETYSKQGSKRTLIAEFWYPKEAGKFPLIVFSHGSFGTRKSNEILFRELASHGYVVCSIDHTYQCFYTTDKFNNVILMSGEYMNELRRENAKEDKQNSFELYKKWMEIRLGDINFVIDSIKAGLPNELYGIIDTENIGVMGHSLGGSAALGIGRIRSDIKAVIALESPFMCDIIDVKNNEFVFESEKYPVPVLNVYSDTSWDNLEKWPQYEKNAQLLAGSYEDVFNLHIEGGGHLSLTDLSLASPVLTRILNGHASSLSAKDCLQKLNQECLAFFDCYLKDAGV